MENIMDYLRWRGDLSFEQSPFNEVDNLLLSYVSYVNLDRVFPQAEDRMSLKEAAETFFRVYTKEELEEDRSFIRMAPYALEKMGKTNRFQDMILGNYVNEICQEQEQQFSALEFQMGDGTVYVAFRGTDDTIVGWKEDFNLSVGTVPAERAAAAYLNRVAAEHSGAIRVGGHSKGGNLAVYAAAECEPEIQERILAVYNNDGPGFKPEFFQRPGIGRIQSRIQRFIPEYSIFGMLLDHGGEPVVIQSSQKGIMQHDGLSWAVEGTAFVRGAALNPQAKVFNDSLRTWLDQIEESQRNDFITDLFGVLEAPGAVTLTQLQSGGLRSVGIMLQKMDKLSPQTREKVEQLLKIMLGHWTEFFRSKRKVLPGETE